MMGAAVLQLKATGMLPRRVWTISFENQNMDLNAQFVCRGWAGKISCKSRLANNAFWFGVDKTLV